MKKNTNRKSKTKLCAVLLIFVLAVSMLAGCSSIQDMTFQEDGSGSYEQTVQMTVKEWNTLKMDELYNEQSITQMNAMGYNVSLTDITIDDTPGKQLKMTQSFKSPSEFSAGSLMGAVSVKFNKNYFSMASSYYAGASATAGSSDMTQLLQQAAGSDMDMAAIMEMMANMTAEMKVTFPYEVTDTNGVIQEDGKTVLWDTEKSQKLAQMYATFNDQKSKKAPAFTGAENGKNYNTLISLAIDSDVLLNKVTINNTETTQADQIVFSEEGLYRVVAQDKGGNKTKITFRIDMTKPSVAGVKNGGTYTKSRTIKFSDKGSGIKKAVLNGKTIKTGKKVTKKGSYTLKVTDRAGNTKTVKFKIK